MRLYECQCFFYVSNFVKLNIITMFKAYRLYLQAIVVGLHEIKGFVVFTLPYKEVFYSISSIHCIASRIKILLRLLYLVK